MGFLNHICKLGPDAAECGRRGRAGCCDSDEYGGVLNA